MKHLLCGTDSESPEGKAAAKGHELRLSEHKRLKVTALFLSSPIYGLPRITSGR